MTDRRIQAEFLDVGHVLVREGDGAGLLVESVKSRPGRIVTAKLSDGTTRRFKATEVVAVR